MSIALLRVPVRGSATGGRSEIGLDDKSDPSEEKSADRLPDGSSISNGDISLPISGF